MESRWKVHRDQSGEPLYVMIVNRDITEKKALEDEPRAQRMECIGALASAIAHDLNNVLPAVLISIRGLGRSTFMVRTGRPSNRRYSARNTPQN